VFKRPVIVALIVFVAIVAGGAAGFAYVAYQDSEDSTSDEDRVSVTLSGYYNALSSADSWGEVIQYVCPNSNLHEDLQEKASEGEEPGNEDKELIEVQELESLGGIDYIAYVKLRVGDSVYDGARQAVEITPDSVCAFGNGPEYY